MDSTIARYEWHNLYSDSWQGDMIPEAFSHPAKFSRGLIRQIYAHLIERGYVKPGDTVVDPFGGVAAGALDAMRHGLHWHGVELEEKFVGLGQGNIALWNGRYSEWLPQWGTAEIVQGDSRRLCEVLSGAGVVVGSPPYAQIEMRGSRGQMELDRIMRKVDSGEITSGELFRLAKQGRLSPNEQANNMDNYGSTPGQLGSMAEVDGTAVIGSKPFGTSLETKDTEFWAKANPTNKNGATMSARDYGRSDGQLGGMKEGLPPAAVIGSPPYADAVAGNGEGPGARFDHTHHSGDNATKKSSDAGYGDSEGQMGGMAVVGSPPFSGSMVQGGDPNYAHKFRQGQEEYGASRYNLYNEYPYMSAEWIEERRRQSEQANISRLPEEAKTVQTFWQAAKIILEQCHQLLPVGGVAVWTTGDFVRKGQRVEFGRQWLALCEAVGFTPLEHIVCWKREPGPVQVGMFEDRDMTIDRVSFFRRLANQNNPDAAILNEDVWIVQKV